MRIASSSDEERLVAHELAEDAREAAVGPRAGLLAEERAVRPDHPDRVGDEQRQAGRRGTARHLADAEVLGEEQVADDVERVVAGLAHHVRDGPALPAQVLGTAEGTEPDIRPARRARVRRATGRELGTDAVARGPVRETFLERSGSAGLDPLRELDEQPRRRPLRGVGVERDVEPFGARVVDQREHRLGPPGVRLAVVEVGDVRRRLGPPADLDRLAERIEVAVAQRVANVGVVEAAVPAGLLA